MLNLQELWWWCRTRSKMFHCVKRSQVWRAARISARRTCRFSQAQKQTYSQVIRAARRQRFWKCAAKQEMKQNVICQRFIGVSIWTNINGNWGVLTGGQLFLSFLFPRTSPSREYEQFFPAPRWPRCLGFIRVVLVRWDTTPRPHTLLSEQQASLSTLSPWAAEHTTWTAPS